jgi:hypothetical protein
MTSQYGAYALRAGLAILYAPTRMHTPTRPGTHMQAPTRKHAHTDEYVILNAFLQQQWFRECASLLRYSTLPVLLRDANIPWSFEFRRVRVIMQGSLRVNVN